MTTTEFITTGADTIAAIDVTPFDARQWEKNAGALRHLSKE